MQFSGNSVQKRVISVRRSITNQKFWLVNKQWNSQSFRCRNIWIRWKFCILTRLSLATVTRKQVKNSFNKENIVKSNAFWLSVWKKLCSDKAISKEIENYESRRKLKTNMVKPRRRRFRFIESDSDTEWIMNNSLNCLVGL